MRLLLTGATGFVAPYVARAVRAAAAQGDLTIAGAASEAGVHPDIGDIHALELADKSSVRAVFAKVRPTHVVHLGAVSAFAIAEKDPALAWSVNALGTLHCAQALQEITPGGRFVFASSAQVYAAADKALGEDAPLAARSEYAASKIAAENALMGAARRGLRVVTFRPFNHTGPGQSETFVVPRFAAQIARIETGGAETKMRVGNLTARRDFLDVRDVARAYALALNADHLQAHEVFNLASGRSESIQWILDFLVSRASRPIGVETDQALWRPDDAATLHGDASRAQALLGWRPQITLEQTLQDVLDHCRSEARAS